MNNFKERVLLSDKIESRLAGLFDRDQVSVQKFGSESIVGDNKALEDYLKQPEVNTQASAMIVKFAPDYILLKKDEPKKLFFLDVKHSVTPIWSKGRIDKIRGRNRDNSLKRSDIGVIAREALLSYKRFYPDTIVLMASPYNPKLLMAQFAEQVRCLYCYRNPGNGEYDCGNCPSKKGLFFDIERAVNSNGSQTPMTDVDLRSFEAADAFFENKKIKVNKQILNEIKQTVKQETIEFGNIDETIKNGVRRELAECGCDWIGYTVYSKEGNNFIHTNRQCFCLKDKGGNRQLETYHSILQEKADGDKRKCKFCYERII